MLLFNFSGVVSIGIPELSTIAGGVRSCSDIALVLLVLTIGSMIGSGYITSSLRFLPLFLGEDFSSDVGTTGSSTGGGISSMSSFIKSSRLSSSELKFTLFS